MKQSSAKQKGRVLVKQIIDLFKPLDPNAHEVVGSGSGLNKGDLQLPNLGIAIEAKNHESYAMSEWVKQLKEEEVANDIVALGFRDPKTPQVNPDIYFVLSSENMYKLVKGYKNRVGDLDKIPGWFIRKLRQDLNQFLKYIEK